MSDHAHALEWETSPWPIIISIGLLLFAPLAFSFKYVYEKPSASIICLALGGGLILISVIGWVKDGLEDKHGWGAGLQLSGNALLHPGGGIHLCGPLRILLGDEV